MYAEGHNIIGYWENKDYAEIAPLVTEALNTAWRHHAEDRRGRCQVLNVEDASTYKSTMPEGPVFPCHREYPMPEYPWS